MRLYQNRECGNVHLTYDDMLREGAEMYDLGDPCNSCSWQEYYDWFPDSPGECEEYLDPDYYAIFDGYVFEKTIAYHEGGLTLPCLLIHKMGSDSENDFLSSSPLPATASQAQGILHRHGIM